MTKLAWMAIAGAALAASPQAAFAQADAAALAQLDADTPGTLINDPTRLDWERQGENVNVKTLTDAAIPGGGAANRYTVTSAGPNPYSIQAIVPITQAIKKGDTVTIGFWARTEAAQSDDGKARLGVRIQLNQDPWPGFADTALSLGSEWDWHEVTGTANVDIPRDSGILAFHLATERQTVDIGQTIVVKGASAIAGTT